MNQLIDLELLLEVSIEAKGVRTELFRGLDVDTPSLVETGALADFLDGWFPEFFELGLLVGDTGEGLDEGGDGIGEVGEVLFENLLPEFHDGAVVVPVGFPVGETGYVGFVLVEEDVDGATRFDGG